MGEIKMIATTKAPAAIGPYSQAVSHQGIIFISGQLPIDPQTGELCQEDVTVQTELVMSNIQSILFQAGSSLDKVLKTTIYVADLDDFGKINETYGKFFGSHLPARACIQAAKLPKNARLEIEVIAVQ